MMMDERPETTEDEVDPTETGVKSDRGAEPGTTQRAGSGDTRVPTDGSGDTR